MKQIRRIRHEEPWLFSVVDIIDALTDSGNPHDYWYRMKRREKETSGIELSTPCRQLKLTSADGKSYKTDAVNTEAAFRIIQSIPSPKAETFKRWLAQIGYRHVQEIENLALAQQRMRTLYRDKGYPDDWVEKRVRSMPSTTNSPANGKNAEFRIKKIRHTDQRNFQSHVWLDPCRLEAQLSTFCVQLQFYGVSSNIF